MPLLTINGYAHNYEEVGEGPPLVFLGPTRFTSAKAWAPYFQEHGAGFRTILPDPRGLGGSAHTAEVRPQDWVADLKGLLDALDLPAVHLAGGNMGSPIAARFAAEHPERVLTLMLTSAIAYSYPAADAFRRSSADVSSVPPDRAEAMREQHGEDWPAVNKFYLDMQARPDFHDYYDIRKVAATIRAPTLLLAGDIHDDIHPVAHSVELHRLIPISWLAIFPNTQNALRDRSQESWKTIKEFMAAFDARSAGGA